MAESSEGVCVAYIFIRYSHPFSVPAMLEILISQLTEGRPDVAKVVEAAYAAHKKGRDRLNEKELQTIMSQAIALFGTRFLILDGLDETSAEKQYALLRLLSPLDVKLFVTSRPLAKLEPKFTGATFFRVAAQERDIRLHVDDRISRHPDLEDLLADPDFKEQVILKIILKSDGM
jgi:ankyrin repeat domain-containing protein 50